MSTRSMIARPLTSSPTGRIEGRYHHWDGYLSGVGQTLWQLYFGHFNRDVEAMHTFLIDDHPAGWSTINGADFTKSPGYGSPDGPQCFCHGERHEEGSKPYKCEGAQCTGKNCDPVYIEWVYVLHPNGLTVYTSESEGGDYRHRFFGTYPWDQDEPDWNALEKAYWYREV